MFKVMERSKTTVSRLRIMRIHILLSLLVLSVCVPLLWDRLICPMPASTGNIEVASETGLAIVAAARNQVGKTLKYDPGYVPLDYPMGDIPIERGVCTDVVIRALRDALGMDLQQLVHEDMSVAFDAYPKKWRLERPDRNIDHRRVPNLMKYFERKGFSIPVSDKRRDYLPGDILTSTTFGRFPHIMIVSDTKTKRGVPLIIHNSSRGTREEEKPILSSITGHYRITQKGK